MCLYDSSGRSEACGIQGSLHKSDGVHQMHIELLFMMHHEHPWCIVSSHDASWALMRHHEYWWCLMGASWCIMRTHDASWVLMMHPGYSTDDASWQLMMHHEYSWCENAELCMSPLCLFMYFDTFKFQCGRNCGPPRIVWELLGPTRITFWVFKWLFKEF